jgi:uncharacterized protein (DUF934 family)
MPILIDLYGNRIEEFSSACVKVLHLKGGDDLALDGQKINEHARVEIAFETFTDGRGYSLAKLLRDRHHCTVDIRATGDVTIDQLGYLMRCGFTTFALRDDQDAHLAKHYLSLFCTAYQRTHPIAPSVSTSAMRLNHAQ